MRKVIFLFHTIYYNWAVNFSGKIPALIFMLLYLFTSSAALELFKLPALIGHYYDHRETNNAINLSTFLMQHYYYEDGTDKDTEEDNKLPFKTLENANSVSFISLPPPHSQEYITGTKKEIRNVFGIYTNNSLPSQYLNAIWHPPCSC